MIKMIKMKSTKSGHYLFGTTKIGERGQIVIPQEARIKYNMKPGDSVVIVGDDRGLAIVKADLMNKIIAALMGGAPEIKDEENKEPGDKNAL